MGSKSDYDVVKECAKVFDNFGVEYEMIISSAHRSPERTKKYVQEAEEKGACVFIAAAGMAAHLAGAIAACSTKPVIGVPLASSSLNGIDALLSTVQMPTSMPVATVAIGKAGAINSAYLAIQILALENDELKERLKQDRQAKEESLVGDSKTIEVLL